MSTKYVIAAAVATAVAVEASRPLSTLRDQSKFVNRLYDEEQKGWSANAGISGGAGGRPQWQVGVSKTWEEEEQSKFVNRPSYRPSRAFDEEEQKGWSANAGISGGAGGRPQWNVGVSKSWEEEEQKLRLNKIVKGIKKANNVINKAEQIGLLDEEAKANWNFNAGINGGAGGKPQWNAQIGATWDEEQNKFVNRPTYRPSRAFDEEEQKGWSANAGISGGAGGRPQWQVGVSKTWEEEEQKLRLNKIVKGIKKANNVINKAEQIGLLEEDEEQIYLERPCRGRECLLRTLPAFADSEQADWNFNAGIQGGAGGKPQWNAQIGAKWEEEELQLFRPQVLVNRPVRPVIYDEEQKSEWGFNAGIQGGAGGKPQWNVGINGQWDEEQGIYNINPGVPKVVKFDEEQKVLPINPNVPKLVRFDDEEQFDYVPMPILISRERIR